MLQCHICDVAASPTATTNSKSERTFLKSKRAEVRPSRDSQWLLVGKSTPYLSPPVLLYSYYGHCPPLRVERINMCPGVNWASTTNIVFVVMTSVNLHNNPEKPYLFITISPWLREFKCLIHSPKAKTLKRIPDFEFWPFPALKLPSVTVICRARVSSPGSFLESPFSHHKP